MKRHFSLKQTSMFLSSNKDALIAFMAVVVTIVQIVTYVTLTQKQIELTERQTAVSDSQFVSTRQQNQLSHQQMEATSIFNNYQKEIMAKQIGLVDLQNKLNINPAILMRFVRYNANDILLSNGNTFVDSGFSGRHLALSIENKGMIEIRDLIIDLEYMIFNDSTYAPLMTWKEKTRLLKKQLRSGESILFKIKDEWIKFAYDNSKNAKAFMNDLPMGSNKMVMLLEIKYSHPIDLRQFRTRKLLFIGTMRMLDKIEIPWAFKPEDVAGNLWAKEIISRIQKMED